MMAAARMAFASCARLLPSSSSPLTLARPRAGAVSFLAARPSPRSGRNLARFCSSSPTSLSLTDAVEETKPPVPGGDDKAEPTVEDLVGLLDVRVGRVLKAWRHPEADTLYVEEVDVGEVEPRTICSGLVNFVPIQDLQDSNVIVLANLKPRNMRGIKSNGMLMAASDASHENVELLIPPEGSFPGERVWFGSEEEKHRQSDPASPNQVQKKKIWEAVQPHLRTTDNCTVVLGDKQMRTSAGPIFCKSLQGARVS
ncbi:hypothetical protein BDA96_01G011200 [Sorghum bicolor]|uniref:tRNA-binding domain-containing protein n=1 Tax=Sorghum bicolor TaxID=4558 RepID=A0A921RV09_SORBI|nr:hypothetical protein BDA96_01G011200 [Sorghum bicolor]